MLKVLVTLFKTVEMDQESFEGLKAAVLDGDFQYIFETTELDEGKFSLQITPPRDQ
jgi:hypothetical protein